MGHQKKELGEVAIRSHMFLGKASYSKPSNLSGPPLITSGEWEEALAGVNRVMPDVAYRECFPTQLILIIPLSC